MLPSKVILDTRLAVLDFRRHVITHGDHPDNFTDEMLHSIVNCLSSKDMAEYHLREFAAEVEFSEYMHEDAGIQIRETYASPILDLGMSVFEKIQMLNMYDSDGVLPYDYHDHRAPGFHDLVLQLIDDE